MFFFFFNLHFDLWQTFVACSTCITQRHRCIPQGVCCAPTQISHSAGFQIRNISISIVYIFSLLSLPSLFSPPSTHSAYLDYGLPAKPAPPPAAALGRHFTRIMLYDTTKAWYYNNMYLHEYMFVPCGGELICPAEGDNSPAERTTVTHRRTVTHPAGLWVFHFRTFVRTDALTPLDRCPCCTLLSIENVVPM